MAKKTPKPRNAQDTTLRNVRATSKRLAKLETRVAHLERVIIDALFDQPPPPTGDV